MECNTGSHMDPEENIEHSDINHSNFPLICLLKQVRVKVKIKWDLINFKVYTANKTMDK